MTETKKNTDKLTSAPDKRPSLKDTPENTEKSVSREEKLAAALRANLRRRKQSS